MEHEMKLSAIAVRRSRIERGWSQEQLAIAAGLSLRTVQRVESEGIASLSTASGLAATFAVPLVQLQEEPPQAQPPFGATVPGNLFLGLAILMLAVIGESGRLPGEAQSMDFAALYILVATLGVVLIATSAVHVVRARQYVAAALAATGTPLVTLLIGGLIDSGLSGRPPLWQLLGAGVAGIGLVAMAVREFVRASHPAVALPSR